MVWKNQVNVLAQHRIFRLLAKGPRLENYLKEIKRADKLEFAAWGGFAQNFADRRIQFEHETCAAYWEKLGAEYLRIPTFIGSPEGPYVPASALRGALRTALLRSRVTDGAIKDLAQRMGGKDRPPRNPGQLIEDRLLGASGHNRLKGFAIGDSAPVNRSSLLIYMLRTAALASRGEGRYELRWKQAPRGNVAANRPQDSTPVFAEMAPPGTVFTGRWRENPFYQRPEVAKALRWKSPLTTPSLLEAANKSAADVLRIHREYAQFAGLERLRHNLMQLEERLAEIQTRNDACLVCLGWGAGFLSKSGGPDPSHEVYRDLLRDLGQFAKALRQDVPFPKTRRIVFLADRPATLPGWALLEVA
jgi:CRISPR-associated protein Csm5